VRGVPGIGTGGAGERWARERCPDRGGLGGRRRAPAALLLLLATGCATESDRAATLREADRERVRAVEEAYVEGWEANDSAAVMATLAPDAVLVPGGMAPIRGDSAIRAYWWPGDGSETRVTAYRTTVAEVGGSPSLAYLRGEGDLRFDWRASPDSAWRSFSSRSVWLSLLRPAPDGRWRIFHRMWHRVASP